VLFCRERAFAYRDCAFPAPFNWVWELQMKNFKPEIWVGISAIALGLSLPAIANAADKGNGHQHMMERLDTDHDGKISSAEWKVATDQRFAKTDANGDGFVSPEEMTAAHEARAAERRKKHGAKMFARADTNNDGKLSKAEFEAGAQKMYERMKSHKGMGHGGGGPNGPGDMPPPEQE
jgi:hypothetical protein